MTAFAAASSHLSPTTTADPAEGVRGHRRRAADPLTGLRTREALAAGIDRHLDRCAHRGRSLAVILVDIDRFSAINEGLGPDAGDQALRIVADRLRALAGESVWRVSGDEFAVAAEVARDDEAVELGRTIGAVVSDPVVWAGHAIHLTASIGVALAPRDGTLATGLIQGADRGMRQAKREGGGAVRVADGGEAARVNQRFALESDLPGAAERGELTLRYQPFLTADGRRVTGAEALLRWRHPTLGDIPPTTLIEIAEESRQLVELGAWVIREACTEMAAWRRAGLRDLRVAVNISPSQLSDLLIEQVDEALSATGIPADSLELELTEGVLMADAQGPAVLSALRDRGVRIALDDFGTGYSSLAYLHRLRVSGLKIDRSFVESLGRDEDAEAVTRAIIALAKGLRIDVLAEGVERPEQLAFLRSAGCDECQGYLMSRPLSASRFVAFGRARNGGGVADRQPAAEVTGRGRTAPSQATAAPGSPPRT